MEYYKIRGHNDAALGSLPAGVSNSEGVPLPFTARPKF